MRILNILTAYNEIKFMPYKKRWCELNGLELYVIDNYSTDGTWEWLQKNKIPSHRISTNGAFDLRILHKAMTRQIHEIRPKWVIFNGADLFPVTERPLCDVVGDAHRKGYTQLLMRVIMFHNTGENMKGFDPFNTYYYCNVEREVVMVAAYHPKLRLEGDDIFFPHPKKLSVPGVLINYGHTKSVAEREETYKRRVLAWKRGMHRTWGVHYLGAKKRNWIWDKNALKDVRETEYYKYVQKLQSLKHDKNISGSSAKGDGMRILSSVDVAQSFGQRQRKL